MPGGFQSPGQTSLGIPEDTGVYARKVLLAQKSLPAGEIRYADEIAGAMAIASVGCNI